MPRFKFTVARDTTESATAIVEADTIKEAQAIALSRDYEDKLDFEHDDGSGDDTYLPDEDDWEELGDEEED